MNQNSFSSQTFLARTFSVRFLLQTVFPLVRTFFSPGVFLLALGFAFLSVSPGAQAQGSPASGPTVYNVQSYGAVGDGSTDDTAAINSAVVACHNAGGGIVWFPPTPSGYSIGRYVSGSQVNGGIQMRSGVSLKGNQTKLVLTNNCDFISVRSFMGSQAIIQTNTSPTDTNLSVDSSAGFSVGNDVLVEIGQAAYDSGEPDKWFFATVAAVPDATHLTLDQPVCYALNQASVTNTQHKSVTKITEFMDGNSIDGFYLYAGDTTYGNAADTAESGVGSQVSRNLHISNISGYNVGSGLVSLQYCSNAEITNTSIKKCDTEGNNQASKGRCFAFAECDAIKVSNSYAANFQQQFAVVEAEGSVHFQDIKIVNNYAGRNQGLPLFGLLGNSLTTVDGLRVQGNPSYMYDSGGTGGCDITIRDLDWQASDLPTIANMSILEGRVNINAGYLAGNYWKDPQHYHATIPLTASMNGSQGFPLPAGLYRSIRGYVASATGLGGTYLDGGGGGHNIDISAYLVSGASVLFPNIGLQPGDGSNDGLNMRTLYPYTGSNLPAGDYITLDIEYWPVNGQPNPLPTMASVTKTGLLNPMQRLAAAKEKLARIRRQLARSREKFALPQEKPAIKLRKQQPNKSSVAEDKSHVGNEVSAAERKSWHAAKRLAQVPAEE